MTLLLDINVLVAFAWPSHAHHALMRAWFVRQAEGWATCPSTEMGFVRLSSNPAVVDHPLTPGGAAEAMAALTAMRGHRFWSDGISAAAVDWSAATTYRYVPDAHLVAVAAHHGGRVATLDRRLAQRSGGERTVLVT